MNQIPNDNQGNTTIDVTPTNAPLFCYNHPQRETLLRCNRCERPICIDCARKTPTGYRCKDCVRSQQKVYETAKVQDFPIAIIVAAFLSFAGSYIAQYMGFFTLFLAPIAGMLIAEAIRLVTRRRRSMQLFRLAAAAAALGSLPLLLFNVIAIIAQVGSAGFGTVFIFSIIWQALYSVLVTTAVYGRLGGIHIR